jgi:hypothetical protein
MDDEQQKAGGKIYDKVHKALKARTKWEDRQRIWYEMRHHGLRRKHKPFPGAADLHFPLIDTMIEKLKPFYFQQIFGSELLAQFTTLSREQQDYADEAAKWFDHKIREETDFEEKSLVVADHMLQSGRSVIKVLWSGGRLILEPIDPMYFIVPAGMKSLERAPWVVHVRHLSREEYEASEQFKQDKAFVEQIAGRGVEDEPDGGAYEQERTLREGLTYGEDETIVLWEYYERKNGRVKVCTFSPLKPETPVRPDYHLPYIDGREDDGSTRTELPFVDFPNEVKDEGWYSPRGVSEIVASFESSLTKLWNDKHDAMSYYNKPMYANQGNRPFNAGNVRLRMGEVIDANIQPITHGQPPISIDQEMVNTRTVAEQRMMMPDFGLGNQQAHRDSKTATEIERIAQLMNTGIDMRARVHRRRLSRVLRLCWNRLAQYDRGSLNYFYRKELHQLPPQAFRGHYRIEPSGSADSWNSALQMQKAYTMWSLFNNDPFVDQGELRRVVLEAVDPRFARRLFIDPNLRRPRSRNTRRCSCCS